ncbi:MAG: DNRLRE domain-containing protein [Acidobacteriota bacterium]
MARIHGAALFLLVTALGASAQTTGLVPLTDLGPGTYQGFQGGLYPGGSNVPPAAHETAAIAEARKVVPRDAAGNPDPVNGRVGCVAFGMSNTTYEFSVFERQEDGNVDRNGRVVLVNGAITAQDSTILADPAAAYWTNVQNRVTALGMTNAQVQVAWLKEAKMYPTGGFPAASQSLRDELAQIARNLHGFFPNLKVCYVSSRIYGGYAPANAVSPEPYAYESGFGVKWLIEDQIAGDPSLNYDAAKGAVVAPLLLWGAYLWADGTNSRGDGLTWLTADFQSDMIHPSDLGQQKVADMLSAFFASDPVASIFWRRQGGVRIVTLDPTDDAYVDPASPSTNHGTDGAIQVEGGSTVFHGYVRFDASALHGAALIAKLNFRVVCCGGQDLGMVADTNWNEGTITWASAPAIGPTFLTIPSANFLSSEAGDVTTAFDADLDGVVAFGLTTTQTFLLSVQSKEGGQGPRLTLVVPDASEDHVVGRGLGAPNPNEVRAFTPGGAPTTVDFFAYAAGQWGVNVGRADPGAAAAIVTGPGPGAVYGPQARGFQRDGQAVAKLNYYAYGTLKYGVNVAAASVDADAFDEIVSGAGPGIVFGPHVRGWNFDGAAVAPLKSFSFFAYGTLSFGVDVGLGRLDADTYAEVLSVPGPGPSFAAQIRGWNYDGAAISAMAKINFTASASYGGRVAVGDVDSDGFDEILSAPGSGPANGAVFSGYDYDGASIATLPGFPVTPFASMYGGRAGSGDVTGDGRSELLCGSGADPSADSAVVACSYDGSAVAVAGTFVAFPGSAYGVTVAAAPLGY